MTTATTAGGLPVDLRDPALLLAALPYLIGFRPAKSVVLLGHRAPDGDRVGLVLRADIPRREDRTRQARALAPRLAAGRHTGVTVAIVGGRRRSGSPPPHAGFVEHLTTALGEYGLPVLHALWTPGVTANAPWACYRDCGGRLPDPRATVVAAAATEAGRVVFDSRAELAALLDPRCPEAVTRRSDLLNRLSEPAGFDPASEIRAAFDRERRGEGPPSDEQAVLLAAALSIPAIRDACLSTAVPVHSTTAREAERLWLTLVRELPAPERAQPAALLGYSAYLRGDGTFAGMALENALDAAPGHVLADLLLQVLDRGMPPEDLLGLATCAGPAGFELIGPDVEPSHAG
ncbi:DUF4192 domain-containing protein [Amycolatopsis eburnea]|uniref:DUF4192 domain-containing protein n=1 Tax=Amycolatopsis eburnea TaxID=2267691 RepID=A0A427TH11_9PSEU|nr:DUF4192 domain-containing protein [Amycolatopsis eburnea]RSD22779.1 DUF4192 domain-containing protein [Amycolatopsis eburnea]